MKFSAEIAILKNSQKKVWESTSTDFIVVRCNENFYAIDKREFLGQGTSGAVFKAYKIDPLTEELDRSKPFAAKILQFTQPPTIKQETAAEKETTLFRRYYKAEAPVKSDNNIYLMMEFIPGEELYSDKNQLIQAINSLTFSERINLIFQLCLSYNLIHHNTPSTGSALIHGDIKGTNIKLSVDNKGKAKKFHVYPIDFGFAKEVEDNSSKIHPVLKAPGTPQYMAPELTNMQRGIKSDIYAILPIILIILNAKDPFKFKAAEYDAKNSLRAVSKAPFDFTGLLENLDIPYPHTIPVFVDNFLKRMGEYDYKLRSDSDLPLRFFTSLNNYCQSFENVPEDSEALTMHAAKLALLSNGFWYQDIGLRTISKYETRKDKLVQVDTIAKDKTFEQFDFEANPQVCKIIVNLSENNLLNKNTTNLLSYGIEKNFKPHYDLFNKLDKLQVLKQDIKKYIDQRKSDNREYFHFWKGSFGGFSRTEKISAASKLLDFINGEKVSFNQDEIKALKEGHLGKLISGLSNVLSAVQEKRKLEDYILGLQQVGTLTR